MQTRHVSVYRGAATQTWEGAYTACHSHQQHERHQLGSASQQLLLTTYASAMGVLRSDLSQVADSAVGRMHADLQIID